MKIFLFALLLCLWKYEANALKLPGPLVYVVTPSSRPLQIDEGRSVPRPFYYHDWRRMDSPPETTTASTTTTPEVKTPDLIFAEFESDSMKNIRKLLEKEKIESKTSTTSRPIYVPDEENSEEVQSINYGLPPLKKEKEETPSEKDMTDYFALYNRLYNDNPSLPVYVSSKITTTTVAPTTSNSTTTAAPVNNVENIWHIIDSEKHNKYSGNWDEVPISSGYDQDVSLDNKDLEEEPVQKNKNDDDNQSQIDDNFALPGFGTNSGIGGENESRAIRTEPNIRFPYVNLKPFQMKNLKKPLMNVFTNSKKGNNMYTSLDNFFDVKNPVRGEAQDVVPIQQQPIDRFNPAQPYLPQDYGSKSKQSSPSLGSGKTVANLVPPPPPPPPKITADDFPAPVSYESFPPYAPSAPDADAPLSYAPRPSISMGPPPTTDDSDSSGPSDDSDSGPPIDIGYRYKPPSRPLQPFLPTIAPPEKPMEGYSYDKPPMIGDAPPKAMDDNPDFQGYHYNKPALAMPDKSYHYDKPSPAKPDNGYHYDKPAPPMPDHGYHYGKPETSAPQAPSSSYESHAPSSYHGPDYPELIFDKPHGGMGGTKGGNDMKGNDMGMVPPPAPGMKPDAYGPPIEDSGFPHDFPGDFKFHDFDHDHDHDYHYHHHPTEPPTTEMPRVNRFSYYYLGKKLYYLPLYFSVYFIIYVGALIIKAVLRHKIVYPNSWRPNDMTATFFSKRSVDSWDLSNDNLHEVTGKVTHAIATAAEKYMKNKGTKNE